MFKRGFTSYPSDDQLLEIESVAIIDESPPPDIMAVGSNCIGVVFESPKGLFVPTEVFSSGEWNETYGEFYRDVGDNCNVTVTISASSTTTLPAGTRFADAESGQTCLAISKHDYDVTTGNSYDIPCVWVAGTAALTQKNSFLKVVGGSAVAYPSASTAVTNIGTSEGNGYLALYQKKYPRLVCCRVDTTVGDVHITRGSGTDALDTPLRIPAGTRLGTSKTGTSCTKVFALAEDVNFTADEYDVDHPKIASIFQVVPCTDSGQATASTVLYCYENTGDGSELDEDNVTAGYRIIISVLANTTLAPEDNWDIATPIETLSTAYTTAIDKLAQAETPAQDVSVIWTAYAGQSLLTGEEDESHVRDKIETHVGDVSAVAGRVGIVRPKYADTQAHAIAVSTKMADERVFNAWPAVQVYCNEVTDVFGDAAPQAVTVGMDGFLAAVLGKLPPERSAGEESEDVKDVLKYITNLEINAPTLVMSNYIALKAGGVCSPIYNKYLGSYVIQSGVTTSLVTGETRINRRRFADYWQDSVGNFVSLYSKHLQLEEKKEQMYNAIVGWCESLMSRNNPSGQRIKNYSIDIKSANTDASLAKGIFIIICKVQMLGTFDVIVIKAQIGETVVITVS